jgi:hypothetical protein
MPACKIIVSKMLGQVAVREIEKVPLPDSKISQCIDDMSHDAEEVLCNKVKNKSFSIQFDGSTDFTNKCHVIAFVRFVNGGEIQKKIFCCKQLPETNKGQIYLMFCLHVWKQNVCLGGTVLASVLMVPRQCLAS